MKARTIIFYAMLLLLLTVADIESTNFIGAHAISLAVFYNSHPTGAAERRARLDALMEDGGLMECGNAQNCVKVCPKEIPLTDSIAKAGRALTFYSIKHWLDR